MANSLLDFVMALVRDPEAAARYAADPARVLADAQLGDVTSADVDSLIPVVAESMPVNVSDLSVPGLDPFGAEPVSNVWASGAATAAFDAFDDHLPADAGFAAPVLDRVDIDTFSSVELPVSVGLDDVDPVLHTPEPLVDDGMGVEQVSADDWAGPVGAGEVSGPDDQAPAFDLFD
ncbi:Rv0340 family IniB-related protein [Mycobacterium sp. SMC-4]|uniref:Rv0340 family IniB-related protein n=1 Tax=Mycobacterium sp. SMC-4 TaxID=2857059 RepID=UPI0021B2DE18|nr:Rv0340 family IniB-related protein [Mycobacterium sp. SMC-4]UXA20498.1 Rv0340 family protein [Mycobacterium sp. SMC-4]